MGFTANSQPLSFTEITDLLNPNPGTKRCIVDMNADFLDDVVRIGEDTIYIDYQQPNGTFDLRKFFIPLQNYPSWSIAAGDIDNNGYNDLLFGGGNRVSFIYANDNGTAYSEDYHDEYIFSQRSTFADIDNNGHLDAFVCHDVDQSHPYRNDGLGNLELDQTLIETIDLPGNYAAQWVDWDNDQDIDLYITKCRGGASPGDPSRTNAMYTNNGDGTYTENAADLNLDDNSQSWVTAFEDYDNDGDMDAFIVNHDFHNKFMINNGDGTFTDTIHYTGIPPFDLGSWHNQTADFNNDGYIDIIADLGHKIYINNGDMTFTGQNGPSANCGIGDLNDDGYLDIYRSGNNIWMNDGGPNNWFKICLIGVETNLNGIGARVELETASMKQIRDVRSGTDFSPMSSLTCHFGIGQSTEIERVIVKWPSGEIDTIANPNINETLIFTEGDGTHVGVEDLDVETLQFFYNNTNNQIVINNAPEFKGWTYSIYSIDGKLIDQNELDNQTIQLNSFPTSGAYLFSLKSNEQRVTKKFIVQ